MNEKPPWWFFPAVVIVMGFMIFGLYKTWTYISEPCHCYCKCTDDGVEVGAYPGGEEAE